MDQDQDTRPIHIIGMTEAEANACLDEHGRLTHCTWKGCAGAAVLQVMFKRPGAGFGQDVSSLAACEEHKADLEQFVRENARPT